MKENKQIIDNPANIFATGNTNNVLGMIRNMDKEMEINK